MILRYVLVGLFCCIASLAFTQSANQLIREGNRLFEDERYAEAEEKYRASLQLEESNTHALFNLGNALYMQGRFEEAQAVFEDISHEAEDNDKVADALHNLGNAYLGQARIPESIEAYKDALRLSPYQEDTRYNLAYARKLLEDLPRDEQPAPGEGDPDDNGDQEGDPDDGEEDTPEQEQDAEQDTDMGEEEQPGEQDASPGEDIDHSPDRLDHLTREDAERILDALGREEERIMEEVVRDDSIPDTLRIEKEW